MLASHHNVRTLRVLAVVATLPFAAKFSPNEFSADTMVMCLMPRREGSAGAWEFDGWDGEDVRAWCRCRCKLVDIKLIDRPCAW